MKRSRSALLPYTHLKMSIGVPNDINLGHGTSSEPPEQPPRFRRPRRKCQHKEPRELALSHRLVLATRPTEGWGFGGKA